MRLVTKKIALTLRHIEKKKRDHDIFLYFYKDKSFKTQQLIILVK